MFIRAAELKDLSAITEIYNSAILNTTATFDVTPKTMSEQQAWFEKHGDQYPIFVAVDVNEIIGWISLSAWSDRCAYSESAEISFYVREKARGKGIGGSLLRHVDGVAANLNFHTLLSRIAGESSVSIHLHEKLGFRHIGVMKEVGRKFGKLLDVHLMQKIYEG